MSYVVRLILLVVVATANRSSIQAQLRSAPPNPQRFEVVSIKPCKGSSVGRPDGKKGGAGEPGKIHSDPKTLHLECQSLEDLIRDAYLAYSDGRPWTIGARGDTVSNPGCRTCGLGLPPVSNRQLRQPIEGSRGWMDSVRYTIDAKTEIPTTLEMMRGPTMQALLEARFKLRIHREARAVPVYELIVAEGGPKLQELENGNCIPFDHEVFDKLPPRRIPGKPVPIPCGAMVFSPAGATGFPGTTIGGFCRNLSSLFDRDVVDKTGITGLFDIYVGAERVMIPTDDAAAQLPDDGIPRRGPQLDGLATFHVFQTALPEIGLRLQPAKGSGVFLVIDHVERPSQN